MGNIGLLATTYKCLDVSFPGHFPPLLKLRMLPIFHSFSEKKNCWNPGEQTNSQDALHLGREPPRSHARRRGKALKTTNHRGCTAALAAMK